jgi:DNA-binding SARP family transcriptional activator
MERAPRSVNGSSAQRHPGIAPSLLGSVLEGLGDGIVLVDDGGRVLWCNAVVAHHLGGRRPLAERPLTCCSLLRCVENTAAGEEPRCLTRLAVDSSDGFAMRRLRLPSRSAPLGGYIAARRIAGDGQTPVVAFQLRLQDAPEVAARHRGAAPCRRGEHPENAAPPPLVVTTLGNLEGSAGGRPLDGDWLQQRPGQVFRYLLCARARPASPEDIVAAIWPDRGPDSVANVRYCMYKLRDQLDGRNRARPSFILHSTGGYRLDPKRLRLDIDVFQADATAGLAARCRGDRRLAETQLTRAVERYRGDFLADDPYAEWAFTERDYLRSLAGKAFAALSELSLEDGRLGSAEVHLQRLARLEPFDSEIRELLIEVCLRRGRRTEALRHYNSLRLGLLRAFGEQPEFDLADVTARIAESRPRAVRARAENGGRRA